MRRELRWIEIRGNSIHENPCSRETGDHTRCDIALFHTVKVEKSGVISAG